MMKKMTFAPCDLYTGGDAGGAETGPADAKRTEKAAEGGVVGA